MVTDTFNHARADFLNSVSPNRPAQRWSWLNYRLEQQSRICRVRGSRLGGRQRRAASAALLEQQFLQPVYRACNSVHKGDLGFVLSNPKALGAQGPAGDHSTHTTRDEMARGADQRPGNLPTRINSFEMAYKMQTDALN